MSDKLQIQKLHDHAKIPIRATNHAAGYDLYSLEEGSILPHSKSLIRTGIAIKLPKIRNFKIYGNIRSRSGLSVKNGIEVGAGVIDEDYHDEIYILLHNHSDIQFNYLKHQRIAQLVLEVIVTPTIIEVEELKKDFNNNRKGGFGSTEDN